MGSEATSLPVSDWITFATPLRQDEISSFAPGTKASPLGAMQPSIL